MARWIFIVILGIYSCAALSASASAQVFIDERLQTHQRLQQYAQNKFAYQKWLISAKEYYNGRSGNFPFYTLLKAYIGGEHYDPFAQETVDALYEYAFLADTADTPEEAEKAANDFQALLERHLPNYTILNSAIPLVRLNPALGDVTFLEWMHKQAVEYIFRVSSGQSIHDAYMIYSIDEENLILNKKGLKIIDTEIINNGNQYYHIHLTEDRQTGKPEKLYTNMSVIVNRIIAINRVSNPDYTYPLNVPDDFE